MGKTYWICWSISSTLMILYMSPIGLVVALITLAIIPLTNKILKNNQKNDTSKNIQNQIDLLAKQLGIEYGTPEEKLIQIASIAAKGQEQGRE